MAYTMKEFAELDLRGIEAPVCRRCGLELDGSVDAVRRRDGSLECADCWFDELGEAVERHPDPLVSATAGLLGCRDAVMGEDHPMLAAYMRLVEERRRKQALD
jgi:hypothetical protein